MVDWATQNRLYPTGYQQTDIRDRRTSIDSSLPFSLATNIRHDCRLRKKRSNRSNDDRLLLDLLQHSLNRAVDFYDQMTADDNDGRNRGLLATYASDMRWPRSVCCLTGDNNSIVVCEQDRCRLLLFTSQLMLRSTCGGKRGANIYEFDSPWSVAPLFHDSSPSVLVADANNRRVQCFSIESNGQFSYEHTFRIKERPFFVSTSRRHFAVSCEKGWLVTFAVTERKPLAQIDLSRAPMIKNSTQSALPLCLHPDESFVFLSSAVSSASAIHQLSITGHYLRCIKFSDQPFLRISSIAFDSYDRTLVVADSFNSLVYSVEHDSDEGHVEILLKHADSLNSPQAVCVSGDGHLIVVECTVTTLHALKLFRHHPCPCHCRIKTSSIKTSETTSARSFVLPD